MNTTKSITFQDWLKRYSQDCTDFQFRLEYDDGKPCIHVSTTYGDCQSLTFEVNDNELIPKNFF